LRLLLQAFRAGRPDELDKKIAQNVAQAGWPDEFVRNSPKM
jgi:hypothetical protein